MPRGPVDATATSAGSHGTVTRAHGRAATLDGVIDIHCHLLPGVDDGPGSMREAVAMARVAVDNGIRTMVCTPHVHERYVTGPDAVMEGVGRLG
jgi:capsular polysaccharide synthesis CpsB/CapC-like protein